MRKPRRLAVAVAVSSLLGVGVFAIAASQLAHADVAGTCAGVGADAFCNVSETITSPSSISVTVSARPLDQNPGYYYTLTCSLGSQSTTTTGSGVGLTQFTDPIPLPYTVPDSCSISVTADIETGNALDSISLEVDFTTGSPTSSGSVSLVRGYGGKCLDDRGNSSANGTRIMIWSCNSSDAAQGWTFTGGELKHNGECANVQGGAASGHKLILWTCNGASNEKWFHSGSNGEYVLSSTTHGFLCLDDPGYSKTNGTQLVVSACRSTSNQHWSA